MKGEHVGEVRQYDIFTSCRRDSGYDTAQLLCDRLTQMRYRILKRRGGECS